MFDELNGYKKGYVPTQDKKGISSGLGAPRMIMI